MSATWLVCFVRWDENQSILRRFFLILKDFSTNSHNSAIFQVEILKYSISVTLNDYSVQLTKNGRSAKKVVLAGELWVNKQLEND